MNITEIFGILLTIIIKKFLLAIQPIQKKQKKKNNSQNEPQTVLLGKTFQIMIFLVVS